MLLLLFGVDVDVGIGVDVGADGVLLWVSDCRRALGAAQQNCQGMVRTNERLRSRVFAVIVGYFHHMGPNQPSRSFCLRPFVRA